MKKQLCSTRGSYIDADFWTAVRNGVADDGGLIIPADWENRQIDVETLPLGYPDIAQAVLACFADDLDAPTLKALIHQAYDGRFDAEDVVRLSPLGSDFLLELYHGPTAAFKDIALSLLPLFLGEASRRQKQPKKTLILTATSGDTGKASLEGFKNRPDCELLVFYRDHLVSEIQQRQMVSSEGRNVGVCAIRGNFDDAQSAVKRCFADPQLRAALNACQLELSSANSINIGRLVPQIVYYFWAYRQLRQRGVLTAGQTLDFSVPTGNFGDILAGYYAKQMGLPVGKLIVASNANNVLTEFFTTGRYTRRRPFMKTTSPSMDILISSNLERLLYHMSGEDDAVVTDLMQQLKDSGKYSVTPEVLGKIQQMFSAGCCDEKSVDNTIKEHFDRYGYLCDTHTAVALNVYDAYVAETGDDIPTVVDSTASPYKFSKSVLAAVTGETPDGDEFSMVDKLHELTGAEVPAPLAGLKNKQVRFTNVCNKENMCDMVFSLLNL